MKIKRIKRHCATCAHYDPNTEECWHALPDWVHDLTIDRLIVHRHQSPEDNPECTAWEKDAGFDSYED